MCSEGFVANNLLLAERFCFEINSNNSFWDSQNKLFKSKGNSNDEVFSIAFLQDGTSLFYGNTDLFDSAREGYTTGDFVVKMNNLKIENENFKVLSIDEDSVKNKSRHIRYFVQCKKCGKIFSRRATVIRASLNSIQCSNCRRNRNGKSLNVLQYSFLCCVF